MSVDLKKVANVLDAAADYFDAVEAEKLSSVTAERTARIDALASKYAEATGEELPANVRKKLAESDKEIVDLVKTMAEKQAGAVESLGAPSDRNDEKVPLTAKEAADAADQRFGEWLIS